ncbi:hypothetical protein OPV22_034000 [Ensete ventricosum]|uniref:Uncharacterized protein n=1 Tax=Ensete ventricosum TaxID=4639 RepID=A0AAV8PVQ9_ENSVE|nr:hypothetical protein OPV22_034000 [Ensete ventricosum]
MLFRLAMEHRARQNRVDFGAQAAVARGQAVCDTGEASFVEEEKLQAVAYQLKRCTDDRHLIAATPENQPKSFPASEAKARKFMPAWEIFLSSDE